MTQRRRAAVIVLDGFGLEPAVEWQIVEALFGKLPDDLRKTILEVEPDVKGATAALAPTSHGVARVLADESGDDWAGVLATVTAARARIAGTLTEQGRLHHLEQLRKAVAHEHNYAPWVADTPFLFALRQQRPTWITRTAGVFTGFDPMDPEIMGNSDTGHQQIFNLCVARQVPAAISALIDNGGFFTNEELNHDLATARDGNLVVLKTLLSGEFGDDGYVHSAWRHLEAFLELYFDRLKLPVRNLQVEAVLDGRDSPSYSSLQYEENHGVLRYGFLRKLRRLLKRYGAEECLAWIMGRQFMDRDYKGGMIRKEYELVTLNKGRKVVDIHGAFDLIEQDHASGHTDPMIEPIVVGRVRAVDENTVFFNAVFRADRQEPITAALLGCTDFIRTQATQKKRLDTWDDFAWLTGPKMAAMWTMANYHQSFLAAGSRAVYQDSPHPHNVLHLFNQQVDGLRFMFLTEGVKEKHMGLFSRGRRSVPLEPAETQRIIGSCGREEGVNSDNDLYKVPAMRHPQIADALLAELSGDTFDLVAANFPGADMIGHLVTNHFDACVDTLQSLDRALRRVIPVALANGWTLVLTSDHGNVEHFGPDHGNNDVLTSVVLPDDSSLEVAAPPNHMARLFDVSWTIMAALGLTKDDLDIPAFPEDIASDPNRLVGSSLVVPKDR